MVRPLTQPSPQRGEGKTRLAILALSPLGRGRDPTPLGGGRVRDGNHRIQYNFQYALGVCQHVTVPEAQHAIALLFQKCRSVRIGSSLRVVLAAIQLNNEHMLSADEVRDERTYRKLTAEFEIVEGTIAQVQPEAVFGVSLIDAKISGAWNVLTLRHERPLTQPSPQRGEG